MLAARHAAHDEQQRVRELEHQLASAAAFGGGRGPGGDDALLNARVELMQLRSAAQEASARAPTEAAQASRLVARLAEAEGKRREAEVCAPIRDGGFSPASAARPT